MTTLAETLRGGTRAPDHRPWPRAVVDTPLWLRLVEELAAGRLTLMGLWGDRATVHMALLDPAAAVVGVASHGCAAGRFPSVAQHHPAASRLERTIRDLYGFEPAGLPDPRPWLDHGKWPVRHPLGARAPASSAPPPYAFLPTEGESLHQIPVGPVHAGIIEPGHFRFTANGEAVVRLEQRLGYVHKGIEPALTGAPLGHAARLAGRVSGDSTVAYGWAFARAVEAALGIEVPARAVWLRALMAELERLANHFGDIGAICNDAAFTLMHAHCGVLREHVLRAADAGFGHRLMMDRVVPGGVATDLTPAGVAAVRALIARARQAFPALVELYDSTTSLQDRTVGTGVAQPALVRAYGAGGFVGRASGRAFDARHELAYAPYDQLRFEVPVLAEGDVNARVWIRIREVEQSLALIEQILERLESTAGGVHVAPAGPGRTVDGMAIVEGFRGDVLVWLRLDVDGRIERCHLRDPSWFQWPLLEAAIEDNIVADFPLCNKSFNCSYSGHDL